jgi:hypothetical protein
LFGDEMDTDDLTEMAYQTLILAYGEHDALRAEIGASARCYSKEDDFLKGTLEFINLIGEAPEDYLDQWNLLEEIDLDEFRKRLNCIHDHIQTTLLTPMVARDQTKNPRNGEQYGARQPATRPQV